MTPLQPEDIGVVRTWLRRLRYRDQPLAPVQAPMLADPQKPCYGCAHSASKAPFPGHPSGERPCGFCVRNPWDESYCIDQYGEGVWYDGSPAIKTPMDNYIATDRLAQERVWVNRKVSDLP